VLPKGDPYISIAEEVMTALGIAGNPGTFLVDRIPIRILNYQPSCLSYVLGCVSEICPGVVSRSRLSKKGQPLAKVHYSDECLTLRSCQEISGKFNPVSLLGFILRNIFQKSGTAAPSVTSSLLEELATKEGAPPGQEEVIRGVGSTLFAGGAHTARGLQLFPSL
jgi:hypothetical protein